MSVIWKKCFTNLSGSQFVAFLLFLADITIHCTAHRVLRLLTNHSLILYAYSIANSYIFWYDAWLKRIRQTSFCFGWQDSGLILGLCPANEGHRYHYSDVIIDTVASQIASLTIVTQPFIQGQIKENIKALCHWLLWGDRWPVNSLHKAPVTRKMFPLGEVIMQRNAVSHWLGANLELPLRLSRKYATA